MNVETMVMEAYEAPKVQVAEVEVEKGYAGSNESLGTRNRDMEW
jgi:hypothetical protein